MMNDVAHEPVVSDDASLKPSFDGPVAEAHYDLTASNSNAAQDARFAFEPLARTELEIQLHGPIFTGSPDQEFTPQATDSIARGLGRSVESELEALGAPEFSGEAECAANFDCMLDSGVLGATPDSKLADCQPEGLAPVEHNTSLNQVRSLAANFEPRQDVSPRSPSPVVSHRETLYNQIKINYPQDDTYLSPKSSSCSPRSLSNKRDELGDNSHACVIREEQIAEAVSPSTIVQAPPCSEQKHVEISDAFAKPDTITALAPQLGCDLVEELSISSVSPIKEVVDTPSQATANQCGGTPLGKNGFDSSSEISKESPEKSLTKLSRLMDVQTDSEDVTGPTDDSAHGIGRLLGLEDDTGPSSHGLDRATNSSTDVSAIDVLPHHEDAHAGLKPEGSILDDPTNAFRPIGDVEVCRASHDAPPHELRSAAFDLQEHALEPPACLDAVQRPETSTNGMRQIVNIDGSDLVLSTDAVDDATAHQAIESASKTSVVRGACLPPPPVFTVVNEACGPGQVEDRKDNCSVIAKDISDVGPKNDTPSKPQTKSNKRSQDFNDSDANDSDSACESDDTDAIIAMHGASSDSASSGSPQANATSKAEALVQHDLEVVEHIEADQAELKCQREALIRSSLFFDEHDRTGDCQDTDTIKSAKGQDKDETQHTTQTPRGQCCDESEQLAEKNALHQNCQLGGNSCDGESTHLRSLVQGLRRSIYEQCTTAKQDSVPLVRDLSEQGDVLSGHDSKDSAREPKEFTQLGENDGAMELLAAQMPAQTLTQQSCDENEEVVQKLPPQDTTLRDKDLENMHMDEGAISSSKVKDENVDGVKKLPFTKFIGDDDDSAEQIANLEEPDTSDIHCSHFASDSEDRQGSQPLNQKVRAASSDGASIHATATADPDWLVASQPLTGDPCSETYKIRDSCVTMTDVFAGSSSVREGDSPHRGTTPPRSPLPAVIEARQSERSSADMSGQSSRDGESSVIESEESEEGSVQSSEVGDRLSGNSASNAEDEHQMHRETPKDEVAERRHDQPSLSLPIASKHYPRTRGSPQDTTKPQTPDHVSPNPRNGGTSIWLKCLACFRPSDRSDDEDLQISHAPSSCSEERNSFIVKDKQAAENALKDAIRSQNEWELNQALDRAAKAGVDPRARKELRDKVDDHRRKQLFGKRSDGPRDACLSSPVRERDTLTRESSTEPPVVVAAKLGSQSVSEKATEIPEVERPHLNGISIANKDFIKIESGKSDKPDDTSNTDKGKQVLGIDPESHDGIEEIDLC